MLEGPLTFVDIDTQRDFLEPGGALFVPGSEAIRGNLARLTEYARANGIPVLATACAHRRDDPEPEPFPPHCLVGTPGQKRIHETACSNSVILGPDDQFKGDQPPAHLTLEKRKYDVFTRNDAGRVVDLYGASTFVVYGVATDYCIRCAVEGLLARGRRVLVVVDAIRAVDSQAEPGILTELARRGAVLTLTDVVCS